MRLPYFSIEGHIHSVFLNGQPIEDPHYNVTFPGPLFNADPLALVQLLIHPQAELHDLHLIIHSSSSLPFLGYGWSFNTPAIGGIPLCLRDANMIIALQVCPCL